MSESTYSIDDALRDRVRKRIGRDNATIEIREEYYNAGFCETCSYPEYGFSVHADGEQVWPSEDYLREFGGVPYADLDGNVSGKRLSSFGQFDAWLNFRDWDDGDDY